MLVCQISNNISHIKVHVMYDVETIVACTNVSRYHATVYPYPTSTEYLYQRLN